MIASMDAAAIATSVRNGELRAEQVLDACIARIDATEPQVNAFTDRTFDRARREARAIDAKRARGEPLPALAGVPYAVKNLFDIEGLVTRAGSKLLLGSPPAAADAVLAAAYRRRNRHAIHRRDHDGSSAGKGAGS